MVAVHRFEGARMWWSLCLLVLAFGPQRAEPTIDATTDASLARTAKAVKEALPSAQREKFDQAVNILMSDYLQTHPDEPAAQARAWSKSLNGKTAYAIMSAAETKVREIMAVDAKRRDKIVSRDLPASTPAKMSRLACEAVLSTGIGPTHPSEAEMLQVAAGSFFKPEAERNQLLNTIRLDAESRVGTDKLAIEIEGDSMKFMTRAAVDAGIAATAPFRIVRNDQDALVAIAVDDIANGVAVNSFLLNKKNGLAVWTKARSRFLLEQPDTAAYYLRCQ
jgi:hypothetical protein